MISDINSWCVGGGSVVVKKRQIRKQLIEQNHIENAIIGLYPVNIFFGNLGIPRRAFGIKNKNAGINTDVIGGGCL